MTVLIRIGMTSSYLEAMNIVATPIRWRSDDFRSEEVFLKNLSMIFTAKKKV